jgi:hypothetical protein
VQAAKLVVEKEMFNAIDSIKEITRSASAVCVRIMSVGIRQRGPRAL